MKRAAKVKYPQYVSDALDLPRRSFKPKISHVDNRVPVDNQALTPNDFFVIPLETRVINFS